MNNSNINKDNLYEFFDNLDKFQDQPLTRGSSYSSGDKEVDELLFTIYKTFHTKISNETILLEEMIRKSNVDLEKMEKELDLSFEEMNSILSGKMNEELTLKVRNYLKNIIDSDKNKRNVFSSYNFVDEENINKISSKILGIYYGRKSGWGQGESSWKF